MFIITIFNTETEEEFVETAEDHKDLDKIVESIHNIYGDILYIDIKEVEKEIETKRYSEKPAPLYLEQNSVFSVEKSTKYLKKPERLD